MPRLDVFLKTITKLGAMGMTLRSNSNIVLHFPSGDRHAVQKTSHADLTDILNEAAPADVTAALYMEQPAAFEHEFDAATYRVEIRHEGQGIAAHIEPAPVEEPARPTPVDPAQYASQKLERPEDEAPAALAPALAKDESDFSSLVQGNTIDAPAAPPATTPAPSVEVSLADDGISIGVDAAEASPAPDPEPAASDPAPLPPNPAQRAVPVAPAPATATPAPAAAYAPSPTGTAVAVPPPTVRARGLVNQLCRRISELGASDLHLSSGCPPYLRLHGTMQTLDDVGVLDPEVMYAELYAIMPERNREEFARRNDTDFAYEIPKLSRYRVNIFRDRHGPGLVIRAIPFEILTVEQLGLPTQVLQLCDLTKGLVLVTGPTGSGKSTTLATLIDYINQKRSDHIITIEDPIEFVHRNKKCLVNQREVHLHTDSFKNALRAALREDPDIVLVGEMRDLETIAIAVETAETGHLVFGTLHTTTAPSTVDRIIDQFPPDQQEQIRVMLAESLRGVIAQNLCKRVGGGRVAAYEVLIADRAVANLIREKKTFQLFSLMQTGKNKGMRTLSDSLLHLVREGLVDPTEAYLKAADKAELRTQLEREGHEIRVSGEE